VNFGAIIADSWSAMRRVPALWALTTMSAVQIALYTIIVAGVIAPMAVLAQAVSFTGLSGNPSAGANAAQAARLDIVVSQVGHWIGGHTVTVTAAAVALLALWGASGVLDVAATVGAITQAQAFAKGERPSVAAGMRDGFAIWWKTIGLLAVAAAPALLYLLVYALVTLYTISLPLYTGSLPNPAAISSGNVLMAPVSAIASIAGVPLGVIVALGLRFAALEGLDWRSAFVRGWEMLRRRFAVVAIMYLIITAVAAVAWLACLVAIGAAGLVIAAAFGLAGGFSGSTFGTPAFVAVLAVAVAIPGFVVTAATLLWQSVSWTAFWRHVMASDTAAQTLTRTSIASAENPGLLAEGA
jgi:hypothetical protein